ncbi:hypothetical protein N8772_01150 [Rickettsiales bacterium]|nr:hypothetical protein [Rickettsiales bacterium]
MPTPFTSEENPHPPSRESSSTVFADRARRGSMEMARETLFHVKHNTDSLIQFVLFGAGTLSIEKFTETAIELNNENSNAQNKLIMSAVFCVIAISASCHLYKKYNQTPCLNDLKKIAGFFGFLGIEKMLEGTNNLHSKKKDDSSDATEKMIMGACMILGSTLLYNGTKLYQKLKEIEFREQEVIAIRDGEGGPTMSDGTSGNQKISDISGDVEKGLTMSDGILSMYDKEIARISPDGDGFECRISGTYVICEQTGDGVIRIRPRNKDLPSPSPSIDNDMTSIVSMVARSNSDAQSSIASEGKIGKTR